MTPTRLALVVALACCAGLAHAELLSLHTAWQKAVASEPAWRIAQADNAIDQEDSNKALAGLLPQIGIASTNNRNSVTQAGTAAQNYDSSTAAITLRQPLFRMQSFSELQRASARGEAAEFRLGNEAQALAARVAQAYFDVLQTTDAIKYSTYLENSLTTQVDAARKAFRNGAGTRIDIDEARARHAIAVSDRVAAENAMANARKRLSAIVGSNADELVPLDEERAKALKLSPSTFSEWLDIARRNSPELAAAGKAVDEASWSVSSARSGHLPTVDLVMSRSRAESDTVSTISNRYFANAVGVQLSVPLFSGGYTTADTAQAAARHQRALASRDYTERQIETRLLQEYNGVIQGEERLTSLTIALESSEEALRSTRHGVTAGTRTTLDVLNAERQLYSTRLDRSRARYDWLMSRMRLQAIAGKLDENGIKEISGLLSMAATSDASDSVVIVKPVNAQVRDASVREPIPRDSTQTRKAAKAAAEATPAADAPAPMAPAAPTEGAAPASPPIPPTAATNAGPAATPPTGTDTTTPVPAEIGAGTTPITVAAAEPASAPAAVASEPSPPTLAKPGALPTLAPGTPGKYAVALGTFGNPDNVVRMLAAAEKLNIKTYTETTANGLTRVRAGPYASKAEARKVIKQLEAAGMAGVLDKR